MVHWADVDQWRLMHQFASFLEPVALLELLVQVWPHMDHWAMMKPLTSFFLGLWALLKQLVQVGPALDHWALLPQLASFFLDLWALLEQLVLDFLLQVGNHGSLPEVLSFLDWWALLDFHLAQRQKPLLASLMAVAFDALVHLIEEAVGHVAVQLHAGL